MGRRLDKCSDLESAATMLAKEISKPCTSIKMRKFCEKEFAELQEKLIALERINEFLAKAKQKKGKKSQEGEDRAKTKGKKQKGSKPHRDQERKRADSESIDQAQKKKKKESSYSSIGRASDCRPL